MLPRSLFICRRKFFMISWMFFLFVISQICSSLIASGEVLPSVYVELSWQFVGEMTPASVATIGIKCRSINLPTPVFFLSWSNQFASFVCVQQGITESISKLYRIITPKQLPFPTVILFFPSITQYSRSKKIFHAWTHPTARFRRLNERLAFLPGPRQSTVFSRVNYITGVTTFNMKLNYGQAPN